MKNPQHFPCLFCGQPVPGYLESWWFELDDLVTKYSHLGIGPDMASLSLVEAWGLYQWLSRLGA